MPAFMSWGSFWNHPKMVTLTHQQRSVLLLIATEIRDLANMAIPEGFILNESIGYMYGDYDEFQQVLTELEELGLVRHIDDPDGWQIERWLNVTGRFRAGVDETRWPCWGQKPLRMIMKQREDAANRQAKRIQSLKDDAAKGKALSAPTEEKREE
jgi:hypothetical protein